MPRRGRYQAKAAPVLNLTEEQHLERVADLAVAFAEPMLARLEQANEQRAKANKKPLTEVGVTSAADQLARLTVLHEALMHRQARGQITADEERAMGSVSKEMRALRLELGLTFARDKDGEFVLDDAEEV